MFWVAQGNDSSVFHKVDFYFTLQNFAALQNIYSSVIQGKFAENESSNEKNAA
jgi:hypothetical protein